MDFMISRGRRFKSTTAKPVKKKQVVKVKDNNNIKPKGDLICDKVLVPPGQP